MHEEETDEISSANLKRQSDGASKRDFVFFFWGGGEVMHQAVYGDNCNQGGG